MSGRCRRGFLTALFSQLSGCHSSLVQGHIAMSYLGGEQVAEEHYKDGHRLVGAHKGGMMHSGPCHVVHNVQFIFSR